MTVATAEASAIDKPFVKTLVRLIRAHDTYGAWDGKPDIALLEPFLDHEGAAPSVAGHGGPRSRLSGASGHLLQRCFSVDRARDGHGRESR